MPKKKNQETQAEQSERFKKAARDLIEAGELDPIEAEKRLEKLVLRSKTAHS